MAEQMVLANRLADGRVVFLAAACGWVDDIASGTVASGPEAAGQLLATAQLAEARNVVVEPCLIDIRHVAEQRRPVAWREAIRAAGPTVRTDLQGGSHVPVR